MESIWEKDCLIPEREALRGEKKADVAVIGAGMAGILIAYYLKQRGADVIVLEANRIGRGQTKGTTGKVTSQHGLFYSKLIDDFGEEKAKQYANANERAITEYRNLILNRDIHCDFGERPAYLYSTMDIQPLKAEVRAAQQLGIKAEFTTQVTLPFAVSGAAKFSGQAQFHPLKFIAALQEDLNIFERSKVTDVREHTVFCQGGSIEAKSIVFAAHYPFVNAPGYYFMRMHQERTYLLALENAPQLDGMYLGVDKNGYTLRNYKNMLLLGGAGHRTGENTEGGAYESLRQAARRLYPGSAEIAHWSAQDCTTVDEIPYIGRYSPSAQGWYVATGFKKWGMTSSMVAATILTDMILGQYNENSPVFSPQRFQFSASAKNLVEDTMQAAKGLAREYLIPPKEKIDALPIGYGGIVEHEGVKVGVYKSEQGETFIVSSKCTHLGCQLEWNPDERSWDCPCHGSRFDYRGNLIDNPAQRDLAQPDTGGDGPVR